MSWQGGNLVKVVRAGTSGRFTARCASSVVVFQFRGLLVTATQAGGEPVSREAGRRKDLWRDRRSARLTGLRRLVDVTTGDNSVAADPTTPGTPITGFSATAGFDEVTGWGSPIAGAWLMFSRLVLGTEGIS